MNSKDDFEIGDLVRHRRLSNMIGIIIGFKVYKYLTLRFIKVFWYCKNLDYHRYFNLIKIN